MALLCRDCHQRSGCRQLHTSFTSGRCESCGKEAVCISCVDVAGFMAELVAKLHQAGGVDTKTLTPDKIRAAMESYPDIPLSLAITRYMLDQELEKNPVSSLVPGLYWGGIHLERVGVMAQRLVQAMYEQRKKSIAVRFSAEDFPETWDHIGIGIEEVEASSQGEIACLGQRARRFGRPGFGSPLREVPRCPQGSTLRHQERRRQVRAGTHRRARGC